MIVGNNVFENWKDKASQSMMPVEGGGFYYKKGNRWRGSWPLINNIFSVSS